MKRTELGKSKEDYLKIILRLIQKNGACRPADVAKELGYSKASVSVAIKKLEQTGYLTHDDWRILLTEEGEKIACCITQKYDFFYSLLIEAGAAEDAAQEEACSLEHVISESSFNRLKAYIDEMMQAGDSVSLD